MDLQNHPPLKLAEPWSLYTGELGRIFVLCALGLFLATVVFWILEPKHANFSKLGSRTFVFGAACLFGSLICLGVLFAKDQFQYSYVFARADSNTAFRYKIAGIWAGQEGSFLLWACTSATFGLLSMRGTGPYRRWFTVTYSVFLASLAGILAYETPFALRLIEGKAFIPPGGNGLTPSLQNYWVVIHPPTIFMGFGSLTVAFAYGVAAMLTGNVSGWVQRARPWALVTIAILGLGLCMGGFWAYETLGWGGFWAWDPVENVSFVPWLFTVTLVHGLIVQTNRRKWTGTNLLLAGVPFLIFVYGTFLTRSGFLSDASVHSFAEMNRMALYILLGLLVVGVLFYVGLWIVKGLPTAKRFESDARPISTIGEPGVDREGMYRTGTLLLSGLALATAIGMSVPFFQALAHRPSKVVDEKLYHHVLVWFFLPLMVAMALGPFVSWKSMPWRALAMRTFNVVAVTIGLLGVAIFFMRMPGIGVQSSPEDTIRFWNRFDVPLMPWMGCLLFVCVFAGVANVWRICEVARKSKMSIGGFVTHLGVAVLMAGLILSRGFQQNQRGYVRVDSPAQILDYTVAFKSLDPNNLRNRENKVEFDVTGKNEKFVASPGLYFISDPTQGDKAMVWPYIEHHLSHDVYLTLYEPITEVFPQPIHLMPGETYTDPDAKSISVTYLKTTREGEAGMAGTKWGAKLRIVADGNVYESTPKMVINADHTISQELASVNDTMISAMLGMNAADKSVNIQLLFSSPIYPVELFYKPMTILVWLGAGIIAFGGLLSAFYRRFRPNAPTVSVAKAERLPRQPADEPEHETVSTT